MARWIIYLKERFPLPVYFLLSGAIAGSGVYLGVGQFVGSSFLGAFFGLLLFFFELRLMDELKDYEKDKIAHPDRPLPRGLMSVKEVSAAVEIVFGIMIFYGFIESYIFGSFTGLLYLLITVYLWLMFKEFFIGEALSARPLFYAITHQVILLPVCAFAVASAVPDILLDPPTIKVTLFFGLSGLGAFFSYEVCRKLEPKANPILKTYLSVYGKEKTILLIFILSLLAAYGSYREGLATLLWPFEIALVLSSLLLLKKPEKYKIVEIVATLSLLVHLSGMLIQGVIGWPR